MNPTHANVLLLVHVVWATKHRAPLLAERHDGLLLTLLQEALSKERGHLHTFGAADDHVHVLVELPTTARLCDSVKAMKGASSRRWNQTPPPGAAPLSWQDGYWARSVTPDDDGALRRYILGQRTHHAVIADPEPWELALAQDSQ